METRIYNEAGEYLERDFRILQDRARDDYLIEDYNGWEEDQMDYGEWDEAVEYIESNNNRDDKDTTFIKR